MTNRNIQPDKGVFDSAIDHEDEVTETFFINLSANQTIAQNLHQSDEAVQHRIRQFMEAANNPPIEDPTQFLFDFQTYGNNCDEEVAADLSSGKIAAIDSTDILPVTDLMNTSFYAVGVGCITSRNRHVPAIDLTWTNARYTKSEEIVLNNSDLLSLCKELDKVRDTKGSWATTYREYKEREFAIDKCEQEIVLLDGPIFTQNLITQTKGRELYSKMMQTGKRFIGVIKDLGSSWSLSKWTAMTLERGEGFVLCPIQDQYRMRFEDDRSITDWVGSSLPGEYVRVVYRPAEKAFAFECALADLSYAVSLLRQDASPTINHEIPLLLETVDWHLRGSNNSQAIKHSFISEIQRNNYRMGVDITNEGDYR